jgi:diguanylate cyclase (GGDEF)-like protein
MKRGMRRTWRRIRLPAGVGRLAFAVYAVAALPVATSSVWGDNAARRVDELVTVPCIVFAAACAGKAARCALGRRRLGWLALATGLSGWAAGEVIWATVDARPDLDHATDPASAETLLVLYPVGAMASLVLLSKLTRRSPRGRLLLDGVIVWTSLLVVAWVFVLDKQLGGDSSLQPATLIHIFADIVLLTTGILMLSRVRPGDPLSRSLLAGGGTTIAGADIATVFQTGIGGYHVSGLADLGRVIGLGMLALAALTSTNEPPTTASQDPISSITYRSRLWLPYLPLVLAAAVALGHAVGQMQHGPMAAALGILVGAVLIRQLVVLVENQRLLSDVAREAFTDSLTGLANRAHFLHRLAEAVARRDSSAQPIAVLCLDLDNFKAVNDALGHPAGDELLVRVAGRLTASLDKTATVARLGGDEFAVLIEDSIEVSQLAAHRILDAFRAAIVIDGVPLTVRPSIGFTLATAASSCTVDDLLRHADLAMYAAKRDGGQCVRSFMVELPFPSVLPLLTESEAISPGAQVDRVAPEQGFRPVPEVATATRDGPNDVPYGVRWPPLPIQIALAALAIGVSAFTASGFFDPNARPNIFLADFLYPALNLSAAALIGLRAYRVSVHRLPWSLIATAMACSAMGDVIYAARVPDGQSPSAADPAYIAFYPFAFAGLLLLMRARLKRVPVSIRLDSVVCGLTIGAVAAALTAGPIHAEAARAPATVLVGLIYPWGDLVLLALTAGMLPIILWRNDLRWVLLVTGFILFAAADTDYLFETAARSYRVGTLLDAAWPVASVLVAMASWAPWSAVTPPLKRGLGSYGAPVACTIVALGVAVLGHDSRLATTLAALSLIAVAARFSVTFRDISMLAERHQNAMTDELTVLPNRRSLATALTAASAATSSGPRSTNGASSRRALLLLNLCDFQQLSNSIGRQFGDELLCRIANRLSKSVRREDLLARVSDNEFAILLAEGSGLTDARAQAGRLLDALQEPFALDPITLQVDARIAIALCPDHCVHPQELLKRAETAIPRAMSAERKIAVYDSAFELYSENDPNLIAELRIALLDGAQLTCHYQPKINASDGSVHSVEALVRWHHPSRGLLLPEKFLPAAERAGLMRKVAYHTLNIALGQIQCWREKGIVGTVAVNLSTTNLLDLDLVGTVEGLLRTHGLPTDALIIEITESTLVDSLQARTNVAALQRLGVRISLDDYGTGWSSLARLQAVSVDELKLDRVFVARLAQDPRSVAIVRSTVALALSLGADLVAEGVEDEITLGALRRYGCTITQGFVHSPPLPADEMQRWLSSHAPESDQARE